jgi:predicted  nucleic acid-binding Zn-ribbon protein
VLAGDRLLEYNGIINISNNKERPGAMTRGEPLYQLQHLDQELDQGRQRVAEIHANLGETEGLRQARRAQADAQETYKDWTLKIRNLELEIGSLESEISTNERRLYSGSVTNPKELGDLQENVASLKRRRGTLEDELLEAMIGSDEAETTLTERRAELTDVEAHWQAHQAALKDELSELETRLAQAQGERDGLRQTISDDDLAVYDNIRTRYGPVVVATMRGGVCSFCAVAPSSTKLKKIRSRRELLQCGNCKRILLDL